MGPGWLMARHRGRAGDRAVRDRALGYYQRLARWEEFGCESAAGVAAPFAARITALEAGDEVVVQGRVLGAQYDHGGQYRLGADNTVTALAPASDL